MTSTRDAQRQRVYDAEQVVHRVLDRANTAGADPGISLLGSRLTLPVERRFADVASIQAYLDAVLALDWVRQRWPSVPVRVRARAGAGAAHYSSARREIAIPISRDGRWALRELVVLHELAHHLGPDDPSHGEEFCGRYVELVGELVGAEAGFLLAATLRDNGARIA